MTKVKVSSFFVLKKILGQGNVNLKSDSATLEGFLKELSARHGEKFTKQVFDPKIGKVKYYRVVRNARHCTDLETRLSDGDVIEFYPALASG